MTIFLVVMVARLIATVKSLFGFFSTPTGQAIAIVALCGGCLFAGDLHGERKELAATNKRIAALNAQWKAREEKAAKDFAEEREKRDASVDAAVEQLVADRTADLAAQASDLQKKVDAYEKAKPHPNCVLGPADISGGLRAPKQRPAASANARSAFKR